MSAAGGEFLNLFPDDPEWGTQTLRLLAEGVNGGADLNEVYRAAQRVIRSGTREAWATVWTDLATDCRELAMRAEAAGHRRTACRAYWRAANYFRQAEFYLPAAADRKRELYAQCRDSFRRALPLASPRIDAVEIPFGSVALDAYLCHPDGESSRRRPAVIFLGGADSLAEELYFMGAAVTERGAYLLAVDTPGRGSALRLKGLVSRPDYEVPGRAVCDWLAAQPGVDAGRIGLWGISMAGYYAPRVAAFEPRIRALACWAACFDVVADLFDYYPPIQRQMQWIVGASGIEDARARFAAFNLSGVASRIACPTYISHGENDAIISPEAAYKLHDALTCPKELRVWRQAEGGAIHCSYDNFDRVVPEMVDWLIDRLG